MNPVNQNGENCRSACIASILEKSLEEIGGDNSELVNEMPIKTRAKIKKDLDDKMTKTMDQLGYGEISIDYKHFKKKMVIAKKIKSFTDNIKHKSSIAIHWKIWIGKFYNSLTGIPTNAHCILSMKTDEKYINHAVVGYLDENFDVRVVHDPNKTFRNNGVIWDMKQCKEITFLVKL